MNRLSCLLCCAVFAISLAPFFAFAQERDDLFGPVDPAAAENPFGEGQRPAASATEKSVLAGARLQPAADKATRDEFCQCVGETHSESVAKIEQALQSKLTSAGLDFTDAPIEEVVSFIQETYSIPVQLDVPAWEEIGIGPDEPVTVNLRGISLRSALRLLLKPLQLTYIVQDEVLLITTPEEAESQLTICVYDVSDLVGATKYAADIDALMSMIVECVQKDTWAVNGGGEAAIRAVNRKLIVVSQTQAVHEQIRDLLETIRSVQNKRPAAATEAQKSAAGSTDPNDVITRAYFLALGQPADAEKVRQQIGELIENAIPDVRWQGRLENGQAVLLTVLPDRVVLKNKASVHEEVESLLTASGLIAPQTPTVGGFGGGGGGGGFGGGGGGGFFRPGTSR